MTTRALLPVKLDRLIIANIPGVEIGRNALNLPIFGPDTTRTIWAFRRDFPGRDFIQSGGPGGLVTLDDRRYIIRQLSWPEVAATATFTDDEGATRTVQSVAEVGGRGRYFELLARG